MPGIKSGLTAASGLCLAAGKTYGNPTAIQQQCSSSSRCSLDLPPSAIFLLPGAFLPCPQHVLQCDKPNSNAQPAVHTSGLIATEAKTQAQEGGGEHTDTELPNLGIGKWGRKQMSQYQHLLLTSWRFSHTCQQKRNPSNHGVKGSYLPHSYFDKSFFFFFNETFVINKLQTRLMKVLSL